MPDIAVAVALVVEWGAAEVVAEQAVAAAAEQGVAVGVAVGVAARHRSGISRAAVVRV